MLVLGIESSCDETGVALVEALGSGVPVLRADALHSQIDMHRAYGGVVPELASRDHIRRVLPLTEAVLARSATRLEQLDVIAYTRGPGLAGALLVGAGIACALGAALGKPVLGVHHLEGHLLSPFLGSDPPEFPFVALLVSGGHTQLMRVDGVGRYQLMGETIDDAAGEAFDKSAKLMGLGYPGGPALARLAEQGDPRAFKLPRPLMHSGDLDFSFAGLKTAVLTQANKLGAELESRKADLAASTQAAIVEVLVHKALGALDRAGLQRLVVAGGVGANTALRAGLEDHLCTAQLARALPGTQSVHRQRRDDRAGRRHATRSGGADRGSQLCLRRETALAAGRSGRHRRLRSPLRADELRHHADVLVRVTQVRDMAGLLEPAPAGVRQCRRDPIHHQREEGRALAARTEQRGRRKRRQPLQVERHPARLLQLIEPGRGVEDEGVACGLWQLVPGAGTEGDGLDEAPRTAGKITGLQQGNDCGDPLLHGCKRGLDFADALAAGRTGEARARRGCGTVRDAALPASG